MIQVETDVCHARATTSLVHTTDLFIAVTGFKKYNKNIVPAYFYSVFSLFVQLKAISFSSKEKKKANVLSSSTQTTEHVSIIIK